MPNACAERVEVTMNFTTHTPAPMRLKDSIRARVYGLDHMPARTELAESLLREADLVQEMSVLAQRQDLMATEFEHRLANSLQMIASFLLLQRAAAPSAEAAAQLAIGAARVIALGQVHRRLHLLDQESHVELKPFLQALCSDLSALLLPKDAERTLSVTGHEVTLPAALGIPVGFLISEAVTNAVKHATGNIEVRIDTSGREVSLSVVDGGPALRQDKGSTTGKGLGMRLVKSLAKQIDGTVQFVNDQATGGSRLTISFANTG
jgi:two-component sensor histidine kinase